MNQKFEYSSIDDQNLKQFNIKLIEIWNKINAVKSTGPETVLWLKIWTGYT